MRGERMAYLVGGGDEEFPSILRHVLRELGFHVGAGLLREPPPDVVLVEIERGHTALRLAAAQERARGAPVIAVLQVSDGALASHALVSGAHAVYALDTPFSYLRDVVMVLLGLTAAEASRPVNRRPGRSAASPALQAGTSASPTAARHRSWRTRGRESLALGQVGQCRR